MSYTLITPSGKEFEVKDYEAQKVTGPVKLKISVSGAEWYVKINGATVGLSDRTAREFAAWKKSLVRRVSRREMFPRWEDQFEGRGAGGW